jgi:predicted rRNA pseudouridine synthase
MNYNDEELNYLLNFGFVFIDKPIGPSSHEVSAYIKKLFGLKKTGHLGTLDPKVSGVLIIGLNKATRLLRFITNKNKTYVGVMKVKSPPSSIDEVQKIFNKFIGKITQIPPKESAVAKREREKEIFSFKALELEGNKILFQTTVQAGTYIRTLCVDVGKFFGSGKLLELRRIASGNITEFDCINLQELTDAWKFCLKNQDFTLIKRLINPYDKIILLPKIIIKEEAYESVCRGLPLAKTEVAAAEAFSSNSYVAVLNKQKRLIAIGLAKLNVNFDLANPNDKIIFPKVVLKEY